MLDPASIDEAIDGLPTLPRVPQRALEILRSGETGWSGYTELCELIQSDPIVTGRLIALANVAIQGAPMRYPNVRLAVLRLGTQRLISLMTSIGLTSVFSAPTAAFDPRGFWSYSLASALIAERIAILTEQDAERAYLAGLSHRIGIALLSTRFPRGFARALASRDRLLDAAIEAEFGISVPELSRRTLERWRFDRRITCAVAHQMRPAAAGPEASDLAWTLRAARWCAESAGLGIADEPADPGCLADIPEHLSKACAHGELRSVEDILGESWPFMVDVVRVAIGTIFDH